VFQLPPPPPPPPPPLQLTIHVKRLEKQFLFILKPKLFFIFKHLPTLNTTLMDRQLVIKLLQTLLNFTTSIFDTDLMTFLYQLPEHSMFRSKSYFLQQTVSSIKTAAMELE